MKKKGNKKIVENEKEINIYELYIGSIINIINLQVILLEKP